MKRILLDLLVGLLLVGLLVTLVVTSHAWGRTTERQSRDAVACQYNADTMFVVVNVRRRGGTR